MISWPIIRRELWEESRRSSGFWLRVLGAGVVLATLVLGSLNRSINDAELGSQLFYQANLTLFLSIWILVPVMTADCISRERREGTLGLLFLTPLRAMEIVIGKSLCHGLRSLVVLLAVVPIMTVPLLLGGVSPKDCYLALILNLAALFLALAAGLLASCFSRKFTRALLAAELFSLVFGYGFLAIHAVLYLIRFENLRHSAFSPAWGSLSDLLWSVYRRLDFPMLFGISTGAGLAPNGSMMSLWAGFWSRANASEQQAWFTIAGTLATVAGLCLLAVTRLAGHWLRRNLGDESASRTQLWLLEVFCTPRFWRSVFHSRLGRQLDRNPVGWLQSYFWSARLSRWGWCLVVVLAECWFLTDCFSSDFGQQQALLAMILCGGMAFTAAGSFRQERESGFFELLLVTPIQPRQIINGRVRGIWAQYLPGTAILLLVIALLYLNRHLFSYHSIFNLSAQLLFCGGAWITVPVIGLYFSSLRMSFLGAWLATTGLGLVIPGLLMIVPNMFIDFRNAWLPFALAGLSCQLLLARLAWGQMYHRFVSRRFMQ